VEKYRIQDEFRSKEYNLLFHGVEITKMPETQDFSDQLVRSFMTEKLQFAPSLVSNMKFANVHRLPRRTDASKISNSTSKRPPPIVKFCTMRDKMEVLKLALRARQFLCAITKHLPISIKALRKGGVGLNPPLELDILQKLYYLRNEINCFRILFDC